MTSYDHAGRSRFSARQASLEPEGEQRGAQHWALGDALALDRRALLRGLAATAILPLASCRRSVPPTASAVPTDPRQRIADAIAAYDAQGIHRTGTDADRQSAEWLRSELAARGVEGALETVPFDRLDIEEAFVEIDGERLEGIPTFDGTPTGAGGVDGTLGRVGTGAAIGWAEAPPVPSYDATYFRARQEATEQAHLLITGGARWGLPEGFALLNADDYASPSGPPALQLPSDALAKLAAAEGRVARVVIRMRRTPAEAFNVTATVPAAGAAPPLVVMTPRSGWWRCAAERGGGIALWLEILQALRTTGAGRPVHAIASTGHELGHLGLDRFLEHHRDWIAGARAWIHIGANFAARGGQVRLQASDDELRDLARGALERAGEPPPVETPAGERPLGEARNIFDGGGRFVSLLGSNPWFHHPDDRWPDAVDLDKTARIVGAMVEVAKELGA